MGHRHPTDQDRFPFGTRRVQPLPAHFTRFGSVNCAPLGAAFRLRVGSSRGQSLMAPLKRTKSTNASGDVLLCLAGAGSA
jgi:hypothetical protein